MILGDHIEKQGNAARKDAGFLFNSFLSDVLQDRWHNCPKVFAIIVVSVLPAVSPLPKTLHER